MAVKQIMLADPFSIEAIREAIDGGYDAIFAWPTEQEQFQGYCQALADVGERVVAVRLP